MAAKGRSWKVNSAFEQAWKGEVGVVIRESLNRYIEGGQKHRLTAYGALASITASIE